MTDGDQGWLANGIIWAADQYFTFMWALGIHPFLALILFPVLFGAVPVCVALIIAENRS